MNTSTILLAVLAVSVASAFPLTGEAFAQVEIADNNAKVTGPDEITIKFSEAVRADRSNFGNFTHLGGDLADGTEFVDTVGDRERPITDVSGSGTDTLVLRFAGAGVGTAATGTLDIKAIPSRADSNTVFTATTAQTVIDGQAPKIVSAKITDPNTGGLDTVTIVFSEPMSDKLDGTNNFDDFQLTDSTGAPTGDDRQISTVTLSTNTNTIIVALDSTTLLEDATGTIDMISTFDADGTPTGLTDAANPVNPLTEPGKRLNDYPLTAGQTPTVVSAMITGPKEITIVFSEDINLLTGNEKRNFGTFRIDSGTGITTDNNRIGVARAAATDATVILTLAGTTDLPADATGTIPLKPTFNTADPPVATGLIDDADNHVMAGDYKVTDGQAPMLKSAKITGPTEVTIEFTEAVKIPRGTFLGFELTGGSVNHNGVTKDYNHADFTTEFKPSPEGSVKNPHIDGNTLTLTVDLGPGVTMRTDAVGSIDMKPDSEIKDRADKPNAFEFGAFPFDDGVDIPVAAGQTPRIEEGYPKITGPTTVQVKFSENMSTSTANVASAYTFTVKGEPNPRPLTAAVDGDTVTLTITGPGISATDSDPQPIKADETGTLDIKNTVTTVQNVSVGDDLKDIIVHAAQRPTIVSAKVTEPSVISIVFSEDVGVTKSDFGNFMLTDGTGITSTQSIPIKQLYVQSNDGGRGAEIENGTTIRTNLNPAYQLQLADGTELPPNAVGTIHVEKELVDSDGNNLKRDIPRQQVTDGQSPNIISAEITTPRTITIIFTEDVITKPETFSGLQIDDSTKSIRDVTGNGTDTITLHVYGTDMDATDDGTVDLTVAGHTITDTSGNELALSGTQSTATPPIILADFPIAAGQTPKVTSAKITDPLTVEIKFSIPVDATSESFTNFKLLKENATRAISSFHPSDDKTTVTLKIGPNADNQTIPVDAHATIDINVTGSESGVPFVDPGVPVEPAQSPKVLSATITGPAEITILFSENVNVATSLFENFTVTKGTIDSDSNIMLGKTIPVTVKSGSGTNSTILTVGGTDDEAVKIPTDAVGTIDIKKDVKHSGTSVTLAEAKTGYPVTDGQSPMVDTAKVTDNNTVTIKFTEAVNAKTTDFANLMIGPEGETQPRHITEIKDSGTNTITLVVNGTDFGDTDVGTVDISDRITDLVGNKIAEDVEKPLIDYELTPGQAPSVESAIITGPNHITITFSEPVNANTGDFTNLKITYDANSPQTPDNPDDDRVENRNVGGISETPNATITLTVDGSKFVNGTTAVIAVSERITDAAGNNLVPANDDQDLADIPIAPDARPTVESFEITGPNTLTVTFSEPVTVSPGDFTDFRISYTDGETEVVNQTRNIRIIAPETASATFTLESVGIPMHGNATGTIDIGSSIITPANGATPEIRSMTDNNGNRVAEVNLTDHDNNPSTPDVYLSNDRIVADGQPDAPPVVPTVPMLESAMITGPSTVTVTFSEAVNVMENGSEFAFTVTGETTPRNVSATGNGTATITLTVADPAMMANASGMLNITNAVMSTDDNTALEPVINETVKDGQAPTLMDGYPKITGPNTITVMFTEPVITLQNHFTKFLVKDETSYRNVTNAAGSGSGTITLIVGGNPMSTNANGTINIDMVTDTVGNKFVAVMNMTVADGQADTSTPPPTPTPTPPPAALSGEVRIGLLLSNATDFAEQGEETIVAAHKAVADFNGWLEAAGESWKLVTLYNDTQLDPERALSLVQELKNDTGVIVGVPTSASVNATKNFINDSDNDMVLISCCSTSPAPELLADDNIFRMVPDDSGQAPLLAKQIKMTHEKIVIVYRDDAWGEPLNKAVVESFKEMGGTVLRSISYDAPATHTAEFFESIVTQTVAAVGTDTDAAVVFLGWSETANFMAASSGTALASLTWFGSGDSVGDSKLLSEDLNGFASMTNFTAVQFTPTETDTTKELIKYINDELGREPSVYAHSTYDAIWVAGRAIDAAQSTNGTEVKAEISKVALARTMGAMGPNELNKYGDLAANNYVLWQVEDDMWKNKGPITNSTVMGTLFYDANNDGMMGDDGPGTAYTAKVLGLDGTHYDITVNTDGAIQGYKMYATNEDGKRTEAVTDSNGMYSFDIKPGSETTVQTYFFPEGHTVMDPSTSWVKKFTLDDDEMDTFDVGFHQVQNTEFVTLNLTVFMDADIDGVQDAGEAGITGLDDFYVYEYTIGPRSTTITLDANGQATLTDIVPWDFAVVAFVDQLEAAGYYIVSATPTNGAVADPDEGSVQNVLIGLGRLP